MPNDHIDVNIPKAISSLATGIGIPQNITTHRPVASSPQNANKPLGYSPPPHFTNSK